jgi:DNA-binding transcriptional LysR family regulator
MARFELEWLAIFDEVYKTRHVSRAAERLDLAQATVSIALGKLRKKFNDPLFTRTARGMLPTPFADALIADVRSTLSAMDKALNRRLAFDPKSTTREFHIACTDISEVVLIPMLLNRLHREAPGVTLQVSRISAAIADELTAGTVDLAVGFMPDLETGFHQQVLFNQNRVAIVARAHPRVGRKLTKAAFCSAGHVTVASSGTGHAVVDRALAQKKIERRIVATVPSFLAVGAIVARTELIAIVPRILGRALAAREKLRILELPVDLPGYSVKQHWHERFHADPANLWLRNTMLNLFARLGDPEPTATPAK